MSDNDTAKDDEIDFQKSRELFAEILTDDEWDYAESTISNYADNVRYFLEHIEQTSQKRLISEITKGNIEEYFQKLRRSNLRYNTMYSRYYTLRTFFSIMQDFGYIKSNPILTFKLGKRGRKSKTAKARKVIPLTPDQTKELLLYVWNFKHEYSKHYQQTHKEYIAAQNKKLIELKGKKWKPLILRDYIMIFLSLTTGIRKTELISITKQQIDIEARMIRQVTRKGGKIQDIVITELIEKFIFTENDFPDNYVSFIDLLEEYIGSLLPQDPIFPISGRQFARRLEVYSRRILDFPKMHPHTLRHTFGTFLAYIDVHPADIQLMMAHERLATTEIYITPEFGSIIEKWQKLGLYTGKYDKETEQTRGKLVTDPNNVYVL